MSGRAGGVMSALRLAWRTHGPASAGFALLVLVCVFLAMAGPRTDVALRTSALRQALAITSPGTRSVYATVDDTGLDADLGGLPTAASIEATGAQLRSTLTKARLPLAGGGWAGLASPDFTVTAGLAPAVMSTRLPPKLHLVYRAGLNGFGTLTAGRLPAAARPAGAGASFEVAVTSATAARYRLRPGSLIQAGPLTMTVTGIIAPARTDDAFWTVDPELAAPRMTTPPAPPGGQSPPPYWSGAAFVSASAVPVIGQTLDRSATTAVWDFPLSVGGLTADGAAALDAALGRALTAGGIVGSGAQPVTLAVGIVSVLSVFGAQDASAGTVLRLLAVGVVVLAAVSVLLGGQLMVRRRERRVALLLTRGASRGQVTRGAAVAAAAGALPGAAAGAFLAVALTPGYGTALSWWLAAGTLLAALVCAPLLTLLSAQRSGAVRRQTSRRAAAWRRAAAEATLIVLAAACLVLLRSGSGGAFTSLAPVLAAVPVAIVVMRGYPVIVAALARLTRRRRGAAAFTGLAAAARGAPGTLLPGFALVLAVAVAAFGFLIHDAISSGVTAASWQQAGADVTVDAQIAYQMPSAATARDVSAVPGVRHTALISVIPASVNGVTAQVAVLQPAQYAALTAGTPLSPFPASALAGPGPGGTIPVLLTQAGVAALTTPSGIAGVGAPAPLTIALKTMNISVKGEIQGLPGVVNGGAQTTVLGGGTVSAGSGAPQLVLPAWALGAGADGSGPADGPGAAIATPNFLLVTGDHIDTGRLLAVIHRDVPGLPPDGVTLRAAVAVALTKTPLAHDEYLAVVTATAAAAILAVLVLMVMMAGTARSRRVTVSGLRLMGATTRQAWLASLAQTLPLVTATAVGGIACAWALGPLAGPALNLATFTGSNAAGTTATVPVTARWAPLGAVAAGLIVLAVAVLAIATLSRRRQEGP
ncbi:MAG TPA: FtsX-like permease family protein [Trebonia sp.]